jgi:hypothetical protein
MRSWWPWVSLGVLAVLLGIAVIAAAGVDIDPLPELPRWAYLLGAVVVAALSGWNLSRHRSDR